MPNQCLHKRLAARRGAKRSQSALISACEKGEQTDEVIQSDHLQCPDVLLTQSYHLQRPDQRQRERQSA